MGGVVPGLAGACLVVGEGTSIVCSMNSSAFPAGAQLGGCVRAAFVCQALQGSGRTQASLPLH